MRGLFITLEGPEGAGKTTQAKQLCDFLQSRSIPVLYTREPGGTEISDKIRNILLDVANTELDYRTEILLYAAARAQHLTEKIRPALAAGKIVICDRYADSTYAYQGWGRGLPFDLIEAVDMVATGGLKPDHTLLLMVEPAAGLSRATVNGKDRIEYETLAFHQRVAAGYQALAAAEPGRITVVAADRSIELVQDEIRQIVLAWLIQAGIVHQAADAAHEVI